MYAYIKRRTLYGIVRCVVYYYLMRQCSVRTRRGQSLLHLVLSFFGTRHEYVCGCIGIMCREDTDEGQTHFWCASIAISRTPANA